MARIDWGKANRTQLFRDSARNAWSGSVPAATKRPSERQVIYLQALLAKAGRRKLTPEEVGMLSVASASRLIDDLKGATK